MTISNRIENIMKVSDKARNSDKYLWIIYAQKSGVELTEQQIDKIMDMPSFETLRRCRQQLQHDGLYEANPKVKAERKEKAELIRGAVPYGNNELLEELINKEVPDWAKGIRI